MGSSNEVREQIRRRLDAVIGGGAVGGRPGETEPGDTGRGVTGRGETGRGGPERDGDVDDPGWLAPGDQGAAPRLRVAVGRRGAVALIAVAVVAAGVGAVAAWRDRPVTQSVAPLPAAVVADAGTPAADAGSPAAADQGPAPTRVPQAVPAPVVEEIVVSVVGLVHTNGIVRLPVGSRVADALAAAGGTRDGADLLGLNLAQKLADGDQVMVGLAPAPGEAPVVGSATVGSGAAASGSSAAGAAATGGSGGPIDLNAATEDELDALPGVGPVTAAAIIAWRTENGRFTDVEQLGEVTGIGPARLEKLRGLVAVR